jgi:AbrB family looped-hinge helix DNA binding protein
MASATVQARGQITVPQEVREKCGIEPGMAVTFEALAPGRFECQVLPPQRSVRELLEKYSMDGEVSDLEQIRAKAYADMAHEYFHDLGSEPGA